MKRVLKLIRNTEGQALVESALVIFFVLVPLILGMIEFGWIFNGKITLTNAAREGARAAIVCRNRTDATAAANAAAIKYEDVSGLFGITANTNYDATSEKATVTVTAKITPIVGFFYDHDVDLTAKVEMRIE